MNRLYIAESF